MSLSEFLKMWCEDGTKFVEEARRNENGHTWLLYSVYFPQSTEEYGRHMAMILKVGKDNEILKHDLTNLAGEVNMNYRQGIDDWFARHVGQY